MALEVRLFGGLEVADTGGRPIEVSAKKARALFAYLAAHAGRRHSREQLSVLLWGDVSADEQARRSLRQALTVLRKVLPDGVLDSGRDDLGLGDVPLCVDTTELEAAAKRGDRDALRRAVALYRGDFLEGFSARADAFDEWVARERTRLRELAIEAMERLGRLERDAGQLDAAITLAMRIVALEPLRESAHRDLMELHVAAGAPGRALKQYETCRKLLDQELSISPSAATAALAARIRAAEVAAPSVVAEDDVAPRTRPTPSAGAVLRQVVVVHVTTALEEHRREAHEAIRRTLTRFGGRVFRDSNDGVAAVYGAARTGGSTVERAVFAAQELRESLAEMNLPVRIGVASGLALVEERGDGLAVQGEVVSLASCLHEVGSVVISSAVRADLGERSDVRERSRVRGAVAWELVALRGDAPAPRSVLLGRDFELAQLVAALSPCTATNRGRSYLVRGEAGIGKSLLVSHFCAQAEKAGFEVHSHRVLDFGRGMDEELGNALARALLVDSAQHDVDGALARAIERGDLVPGDLGFARRMIGPRANGASEVDVGPQESARREHEVLGKLLRARSGRRPQLLWIDDIHWAHAAAVRQLAHLMGVVSECRALLVMTTRIAGEPDDGDWRRAVKGRAVSTLDLAPLPEDVARALVERLRERRGTSFDAARIVERAGGNPFFLEQLAWADATDSVPGSVQALVQARMDALDESSRRVLQAASVLGQQFDEAALARLAGTSGVELSDLVEDGLLVAGPDGAAFGHALMRDAVYASLTDERRCALHLAAAAHYDTRNTLLRAGHLERARDDGAPVAYAQAADEQRLRGGLARALELCERGAALATLDSDAQRIALLRGDILRELGRANDALVAFDLARDRSQSDAERARAWLGTAGALRLLDRSHQALEALDEARRLLDARVSPELCSQIHCMRGNVLFPSGDAEACSREHRLALELAQAARSPLAEAHALTGIADGHYIAGRMQSAAQMFERCEALAHREGLSQLERANRAMRLVLLIFSLRVKETAERCLEDADRAEEAGALRTAAVLRTGACMALGYLGDWQRMAAHAQSAIELTRRIGSRRFEALSIAYLAMARFHLAGDQSVGAELDRALELSMATGMAFSGGIVHGVMVATASNDEAARVEVRRGLAALDAGSIAHGSVFFLHCAMAAMIRAKAIDEVRRLADSLARSSSEPCELVTFLADLGCAAADVLAAPHDAGRRTRLERIRERAADRGLEPVAQLLAAL